MTQRQRRFAETYAGSGDAPSAAIEAGYSPARARRQAAALLKNEAVAAAVAEAKKAAEAEASEAAEESDAGETVTRARIEAELARIAFGDSAVRDGDKLRALEMLTKLMAQDDGGDDAPVCGVVILPAVGE